MTTFDGKILKYEYILYFENITLSNRNIIYPLCEELASLGLKCINDVSKTDRIIILSLGGEFEIYFEEFENFKSTLHIKSSFKQTPYSGFLKILWNLMNTKFNVEYSYMGCMEFERFKLINDRFKLRFINKITLSSLLEVFVHQSDLEILTFEGNDCEIKKGNISKDKLNNIEEAWISFARTLDYDDWDIVSSNFLPITLSEYRIETNRFINWWGIDDNSLNLENEKDIISILQVKSEWDFIEYLINRQNSIEYVSVFVYTD